jgi:Na+/proline symporter
MGQSLGEIFTTVKTSPYSQIFFFENGWSDPNNFFKQFISGALITIVMTGLDQDMMQKNLSCKNLKEARINMISFAFILIFVNMLFLGLGALLYIYGAQIGIEVPTVTNAAGEVSLKTDLLYPAIALKHLSPVAGIAFILGIIAAAYSSADSALTSLTTSFCVDFLGFEKNEDKSNNQSTRLKVHFGFSVVLFLVIITFHAISNDAIINDLFKIAGYTYGPLLGLFSFGIFTAYKVQNKYVIPVCLLAPILSYFLNANDLFLPQLLGLEFSLGFLIILLNGLLTFLGLLAIREK